MIAFRIADARHTIYDSQGALLHGGRWNSAGLPAIYAAETFAGAMLEVLVHANASSLPRRHQLVRIIVPDEVSIERLSASALPGWHNGDFVASRSFGDRWIREARSAVLLVPSVVTEGRENNVVINPLHPQFPMIVPGKPEPIRWDARLVKH